MALIDKASLLFVPSVVAQEKAFNILPSGNRAPDSTGENSGYDQTRADFDFDRGSNTAATRIGSDGLIKKYRENLLLQSNQFDTTWTNTNTTETGGQSGYDGTNNAWLLTKTASSFARIQQPITLTSGVKTFSVYLKAGTLSWCRVLAVSSASPECYINLSNGSLGSKYNNITAKSTDVGNGWYRVSLVFNDTINEVRIYPADANNSVSGTSGNIYIQDAQLETGMVATDYLESTSVTGKAGVLIDLPRIDYSSGAGALLLEPQRANLVQYSEYINTTDWNHQGVTSSVNTSETTSPEGLYNAVKFTATNTDPYIFKSISVSTGDNTFSFYVKGTGSSIGKTARILFWYIGTATGAQTSHDFTLTGDWQRVDATTSPTGAGTLTFRIDIPANTTVVGDSCYLYGLQLEAGSYATSYIPNHGESGGVTRSFDLMDTTSEEDIFTSGEGVVFMEFDISDATITGYPELIRIENPSDATDKFWFYIFEDSDANEIRFGYRLDDTNVKKIEGSVTISTTTTAKVAMRLENNNYALYYNGTKQTPTQYAGVVSDLRKITSRGREYFNGLGIKQFATFNEALSDSELATLTTL